MAFSSSPGPRSGGSLLWIWLLWLAAFYAVWLWLVLGLGHWPLAREHWPIALTMALGSYVAGSTPMGGGTVAFPVLVLAFDLPATLGRDFSFAVQSIGMTSAAIFILARRQRVAWTILKGAAAGMLIGTPLGIFWVALYLPDIWIKLNFAVIWASFGILHLYRLDEIAGHSATVETDPRRDLRAGFLLGLGAGATVVAATGVGIDMMIYAALVLVYRRDLKVAVPTSVLVMAMASVYGVAIKLVSTGMGEGVFAHWIAAAPVVALGAPLGAFIVGSIGRKPTLLFVAVLCVGQFVWTCVSEFDRLGAWGVLLALAAVGLVLLGFERMRTIGGRLTAAQRRRARKRLRRRRAGLARRSA